MSDPYPYSDGPTAAASNAAAVTPSDSADLSFVTKGLYLGVSGNVAVVTRGGQTVTFFGLVAGIPHPLRVKRVLATGTTAANITAVW